MTISLIYLLFFSIQQLALSEVKKEELYPALKPVAPCVYTSNKSNRKHATERLTGDDSLSVSIGTEYLNNSNICNGFTPLHIAVSSGSVNIIKALLENGAAVNSRGINGSTPLHIAARKGHVDIINLLLYWNASLDITDIYDMRPIHRAVESGRLNAVKTLLDHGAGINSKGYAGRTPLHIAAIKGYDTVVDFLLFRNASVNIRDIYIDESIHLATFNGAFNIVTTLLDHGADINSIGRYKYTPIIIASYLGNEPIVNLLLLRNARLNTRDSFGNEAIHHAVSSGNINVLVALLDHGANVNSIGAMGDMPLDVAVKINIFNGSRDHLNSIEFITKPNNESIDPAAEDKIINVMKLLVERGADINSQNFHNKTVLHEAAGLGYAAVVAYLVSKNASLSINDNICFTPIQWAAKNGNINVVKMLLKLGDDINRKGCNNLTALHLAIIKNDTTFTKFLLSQNANPNTMSEEGKTPLDLAFQTPSGELIKLLLEHRAKVEDGSFLGSKVVFDAVKNKSIKITKALLNSSNHFDNYPTVILNNAIRMHFFDGVKLLISYGGNIEQKDIHGNLPLTLSVITKNFDLVELILQEGTRQIAEKSIKTFLNAESDMTIFSPSTDITESHKLSFRNLFIKTISYLTKENLTTFLNADSKIIVFSISTNVTNIHEFTALHVATHYGLNEIVRLLISYGASLEVRDERGYTPLHCACEEGHDEVVKHLLESGANRNTKDVNGTTPLHIACRRGFVKIVGSLLKDRPATINQTDNNGYSPLHLAVLSGSQEIIRLLLSFGANVDAKTNDLKTSLHFASLKGHKKIAMILLNAGANKEAVDIDGLTPIHFAAKGRHPDLVNLIIKFMTNIFIRTKTRSTPLHLACEMHANHSKLSEEDVVKIFMKYGPVFINALDYNLMSPLHIGSRDGSLGCVEVLVSSGADQYSRDMSLNHPIHYAAMNGHYEVMLTLLKNDPKPSTSVNRNQETPLFLASREGHTDVVSLLLKLGFEGFRPDHYGRTPLHRSASRGHIEIVKLLRENRVYEDMQDKWGFTALNYATSWKGYQDVMGYLSATMLNITLSSYFDISNPFQPHFKIKF